MRLIDIGANLAHDSFDQDRDAVLARAIAAGVGTIVVTGSCVASARSALALAHAHPGFLYATAGMHPHHAADLDDAALADFRELAGDPAVLAMGEMGLDFFRDLAPRPVQEQAFQRQLELATELGKPLFLHQRDAHERFLPILRDYLPAVPAAVVHCFTGTGEELDDYLALGLYIGITGWICDERRGLHLRELVRRIPLDRLMIETDSPYLLPRSVRPRPVSRRNEPMHLSAVRDSVAEAMGRDREEITAETAETARNFFRIDRL